MYINYLHNNIERISMWKDVEQVWKKSLQPVPKM